MKHRQKADDKPFLSFQGSPEDLKISLNAYRATYGPPVVSAITVDGVNRTGDIPASPNLATSFTYPRTVSNGGELAKVTAAGTLRPGDLYKLDYHITSAGDQDHPRFASGSPFFHGNGAPENDLPGGIGRHSVFARVREDFTGTGAVELIRNSTGSMTVSEVAIYKAEWDLNIPAGHEFAQTISPGRVSADQGAALVTALTDDGTIEKDDEFILSYQIVASRNVSSFFIPQSASPFYYRTLPTSVGTYEIPLRARESGGIRQALMRLSGSITFGFVSLRKVGEGRKIEAEVQVGGNTHSATTYAPLRGVWHVSAQGDDVHGTGAPESPLRQPSEAMKQISRADTVYLRPGVYGAFRVTQSGNSSSDRLRITTLPGEERRATVVGLPFEAAKAAANYFGIEIREQSHIEISNLRVIQTMREGIIIRGQEVEDDADDGTVPTYTDIVVRGCVTRKNGSSGIMVCGYYPQQRYGVGNSLAEKFRISEVLLEYNDVSQSNNPNSFNSGFTNAAGNAGGNNECITVCAAALNVVTRFNFVHDSLQYGIDYKSGTKGGAIYGNYVWGMTNHGIYVDPSNRFVDDLIIYNNYVWDCKNGIVFAREADYPHDNPPENLDDFQMRIRNVRVYNNVVFNIGRDGIAFIKHHGDFPSGSITNIQIAFNTIVNCGQEEGQEFRKEALLSGWHTDDWIAAGVVSNFAMFGNLIWRDGGDHRIRDDYSGVQGFNIVQNFNFDGSADPLFQDTDMTVTVEDGEYLPNVTLPRFAPRSGSPALSIVNGRNSAPYNVGIDGKSRPNPSPAGAYTLAA